MGLNEDEGSPKIIFSIKIVFRSKIAITMGSISCIFSYGEEGCNKGKVNGSFL